MPSMREISPFVPFNLYDFFAYLFPGILFATNITIFFYEFKSELFDNYIKYIIGEDITVLGGIFLVLAAIVILYALGHFIATISYILIDRVLVDGVEGYPILRLLGVEKIKREYCESTYQYLFLLFNIILITPFFGKIVYIIAKLFIPAAAIPFILPKDDLVIILIEYEFYCVLFLIICRFLIMILRETDKPLAKKLGDNKIFRIYLIPAKIINYLIGALQRLMGLDKKFPDEFIKLYKKLFAQRFNGLKMEAMGSENYWLPTLHANAQGEYYHRTLNTWLHLYGFARNASAAFYMSCLITVIFIVFYELKIDSKILIHQGIIYTLAIFLGLRYWNLYSHYYSKAVIRIFVETMTKTEMKA